MFSLGIPLLRDGMGFLIFHKVSVEKHSNGQAWRFFDPLQEQQWGVWQSGERAWQNEEHAHVQVNLKLPSCWGHILRGKITDPSITAKLSFELEVSFLTRCNWMNLLLIWIIYQVCCIPNLNVVGICRKRLKGDASCCRKVCRELLRLTAAGRPRAF